MPVVRTVNRYRSLSPLAFGAVVAGCQCSRYYNCLSPRRQDPDREGELSGAPPGVVDGPAAWCVALPAHDMAAAVLQWGAWWRDAAYIHAAVDLRGSACVSARDCSGGGPQHLGSAARDRAAERAAASCQRFHRKRPISTAAAGP